MSPVAVPPGRPSEAVGLERRPEALEVWERNDPTLHELGLLPMPVVYEFAYENRADAERAAEELDGSDVLGVEFRVTLAPRADPDTSAEEGPTGYQVNVQGATVETPRGEVRKTFQRMGPILSANMYADELFGQVGFKTEDEALDARDAIDGTKHFGLASRAEVDCCSDWLNRVLVHGIGKNTSWFELKKLCQEYGEPQFTCIHGGLTALIEFETTNEARNALNFNGFKMTGADRPMDVAYPYDHWRDSTTVRARRLPEGITEDQVGEVFSKAGTVVSVSIDKQELPPEFMRPRGKWYNL